MTKSCIFSDFNYTCATGYMKRMRNLDWDEIVDEVTLIDGLSRERYGKN